MTATYAPIIVALAVALGMGGLFTLLSVGFGPKHLTAEKLAPFECGSEPIGSPRVRFSVKFYQVAILFLVFDIETAFLYPWAVLYRKLSCAGTLSLGTTGVCSGNVSFLGFAEMFTFVIILVVALAYTWRKKAIGWG